MSALLEAQGLSKRFGGVVAVRGANVNIPRGAMVGLIGPNGAGKSTFVNLLTRQERLDSGTILLDEKRIEHLAPYEIARAGLIRTYQQNRLFWEETVEENIRIALVGARHRTSQNDVSHPGASGSDDERVADLLDFLGLSKHAGASPHDLNHVLQRRVEIAQALALKPRVLVLDEPFAGFTIEEALEVESVLRVCQEGGLSLLVIDHNVQVVMQILQYIYVMHHGEIIAEGSPDEISANEKVINVYLKGSL